jgi:hypothetical protein
MKTNTLLSIVLFGLFNAVIFGAGLILALGISQSATGTAIGIAISALFSIVVSAYLALHYAPRLRAQYWRREGEPPKAIWS